MDNTLKDKGWVAWLCDEGLDRDLACKIMGKIADDRQSAYMQGHTNGYNSGFEEGYQKQKFNRPSTQ